MTKGLGRRRKERRKGRESGWNGKGKRKRK